MQSLSFTQHGKLSFYVNVTVDDRFIFTLHRRASEGGHCWLRKRSSFISSLRQDLQFFVMRKIYDKDILFELDRTTERRLLHDSYRAWSTIDKNCKKLDSLWSHCRMLWVWERNSTVKPWKGNRRHKRTKGEGRREWRPHPFHQLSGITFAERGNLM